MARRTILPLIFGLAGTAILVLLGSWQMQRLGWKTDMLDRIEARIEAEPVALPEAPDPVRDEYLRVAAAGELLPGELHVYTSMPPAGVGYRVIAPFETEGRRILIDRGFVPIGEKDADRGAGPLAVEGALVWPRETDRFTAAPDRAENIWFARDVPLMAEALGTEPVMVAVEHSSDEAGPLPVPLTVNIRNPHLEYAVTWFGLAAVWALMTVYWVWRIRRRDD